jgi:ABC-type Mn2+/Zn2+ transport system permease subunit
MVWDDVRLTLASPARWDKSDWLIFGADLALVAGAGLVLDKPVDTYVVDHHNQSADKALKDIEPFGAEYSFGVLGAFYLGGLALDDRNARDTAMDGAVSSLIAAGIVTPSLKFAAGRSRPNAEKGTHDFHPLGGNASFPSGHATQAFAIGSVIADHFDNPLVSVASYGLAAAVGAARIYHRHHFVSDVVAGAIIGTSVGKCVVRINSSARHVTALVPVIDGETMGIAMTMGF